MRCQICNGSGRQGHLGDLSPDCTACRGVGYTKPGMGVGGFGMPAYGAVPPVGMYPPAGGFGPSYGPGPAYGPSYGGPGYIPPYAPY